MFRPKRTEIHVLWKIGAEGCEEILIVLRRVEFFGSEDFGLSVGPSVFKIFDVEETFEFCGYVFQKGENPALRMLIAEYVEDEAFFGCEGIAISRHPVRDVRLSSPR